VTVPTGDELVTEQRRLASASSIITVVARYVDDLVQLPPEQLPGWLQRLSVPAGWRIARLEGSGLAPSRIAVCGHRADGRWDGCETISVFGFTGEPPEGIVRENADCTLRDLDASDITTHVPLASLIRGMTAVRSSGYFTVAGQRLWAQYSTYVAGSAVTGGGRLLQHSLFIDAACRTTLAADIAELTNAVSRGFVSGIDGR
jgi:hypothetical protein